MERLDIFLSVIPHETDKLTQSLEMFKLRNRLAKHVFEQYPKFVVISEDILSFVNEKELQESLKLCEKALENILSNPNLGKDPLAVDALVKLQKFIHI